MEIFEREGGRAGYNTEREHGIGLPRRTVDGGHCSISSISTTVSLFVAYALLSSAFCV